MHDDLIYTVYYYQSDVFYPTFLFRDYSFRLVLVSPCWLKCFWGR